MFRRFLGTSPFVAVVSSALEEARRRGDKRVGTEHLLLGLLHDARSRPARALGVHLDDARAALDALDRAALAAIGLDLGPTPPTTAPPARGRAPWTSASRTVLGGAAKATRGRTRHLAPDHLLLALLELRPPDPAAQLIDELGVERADVRERIEAELPRA